jgi:RNA polymerase sigma-70 factor (ECF subfamily)
VRDELTPDSDETRGLLEEARAGDRRAFDRLLAGHRAELRQFVELRMDPRLRGRVDASDVVQETQLEVYRRLEDFLDRRPMPFHVWLRKTAYERLLMARRQHVEAAQRAVGREVPLPDRSSMLLAQRLLPRGSTPSQRLGRRELARRVHQVLEQLPDADREILFMRNFEERSYPEIACILDIEPTAARKRHGRALIRLHALLAADGLMDSQP